VWGRGYSSAEGVLIEVKAWPLTRSRWNQDLAGVSAARSKVHASGTSATEDVRGGAARSTWWTTPSSGGTARRSLRSRPHQDHAVPVQEVYEAIVSEPRLVVVVKLKLEVRRQARLHPAIRRQGKA